MDTLPTIEEIEAAEANHDPATCGDPTCAAAPAGSEWLGMSMSIAPDGTPHFHHAAETRVHLRVFREREWIEVCDRYLTNPNDFVGAHHWLERHPIFHHFIQTEATNRQLPTNPDARRAVIASVEGNESDRVTDRGLTHMSMLVFHTDADETGPAGPRVLLEHGPYLWASDLGDASWAAAGGCPTRDQDVGALAASYEAAIVQFAKHVHAKYGLDRSQVRP